MSGFYSALDAIVIYALIDPRDDEIRYVGVTKMPLKRLGFHIREARRNKRSYKAQWIKSLLAAGVLPELRILRQTDILNWKDDERNAISEHLARGCRLANLTSGGDGIMNFSHSEETKRKMSASHTGKIISEETRARQRGKPLSQAVRDKISATLTGHPISEESKRSRSIKMKGRRCSDSAKAKISAARKGQILSPEHRAKIGQTRSLKPFCNRGHPRLPYTVCKECAKINARAYQARLKAKRPG